MVVFTIIIKQALASWQVSVESCLIGFAFIICDNPNSKQW